VTEHQLNWRWWAAAALFLFGLIGLISGVSLTERPDVVNSGWLTKAYYALGFFVVGGLDVGTPVGGPMWGRTILWFAYFGAPLLTASAVIDAVIQVLTPDRWHLRRIQDHTIIFGSGRLTLSYLRLLRRHGTTGRIVVVDNHWDPVREQEFAQKFNAITLVGDLTHEYLLRQLRLKKAHRVLLLGDNDFQAFEAATRILEIAPRLKNKVILHCDNLRFMRALQDTDLAQQCEIFNTYNLAATGFVTDNLIGHFKRTADRDVVVMAGFGRFGQSVLEELQNVAEEEIEHVTVIDIDADRRILVADEQDRIGRAYQRTILQGDISHPMVWEDLVGTIDLSAAQPTVILGTGKEQDNLRTALWIKQRYPNALVYARTNDISKFALTVGDEHGIKNISITQLVEDHIPTHWLN
jgi:Trk K+ transport system NAD-binding subunit